jgi:predicted oxidoreductase
VEASLRRLQTDHIDPYQIHGNDSLTLVEETIRALDTLWCLNTLAWPFSQNPSLPLVPKV